MKHQENLEKLIPYLESLPGFDLAKAQAEAQKNVGASIAFLLVMALLPFLINVPLLGILAGIVYGIIILLMLIGCVLGTTETPSPLELAKGFIIKAKLEQIMPSKAWGFILLFAWSAPFWAGLPLWVMGVTTATAAFLLLNVRKDEPLVKEMIKDAEAWEASQKQNRNVA